MGERGDGLALSRFAGTHTTLTAETASGPTHDHHKPTTATVPLQTTQILAFSNSNSMSPQIPTTRCSPVFPTGLRLLPQQPDTPRFPPLSARYMWRHPHLITLRNAMLNYPALLTGVMATLFVSRNAVDH